MSPQELKELNNLLVALWRDLHDIRVLWQVAIVAAALAVAGVFHLMLRRGAAGEVPLAGARKFGRAALQHLQFPITALLVVALGRALIRPGFPVHLLDVVVPLLVALAIIRAVALMLRQVFAPSGSLNKSIRIVGTLVWLGFALHLIGLAPELLQSLDDLDFKAGKHRISVLMILQGAISVLITVLIALWLGRFLETRLMNAEDLQINLRVMLSKLTRALLILTAILIALPAVGIDVTVLSVFGGMLGVGIGFGLQKIASNYISGFIILMDRSISIGDVITVDNHSGQLQRMTARYVVVRNPTGTEALIPNETIITSTVINQTYSDRRVRVAVAVQVSYDTDLDKAVAIMEDLARAHPRVLADPAPKVLLLSFGASGIDLELGVWIQDPDAGTGNLRSDLNFAIWRAFRQQGIEIPYPQREIRVIGTFPAPTAGPNT